MAFYNPFQDNQNTGSIGPARDWAQGAWGDVRERVDRRNQRRENRQQGIQNFLAGLRNMFTAPGGTATDPMNRLGNVRAFHENRGTTPGGVQPGVIQPGANAGIGEGTSIPTMDGAPTTLAAWNQQYGNQATPTSHGSKSLAQKGNQPITPFGLPAPYGARPQKMQWGQFA